MNSALGAFGITKPLTKATKPALNGLPIWREETARTFAPYHKYTVLSRMFLDDDVR